MYQSAQKEERFARCAQTAQLARRCTAKKEAQMVAFFQIQILMFMCYLMEVFSLAYCFRYSFLIGYAIAADDICYL